MVKGQTIAIDATTLEANAALRHIVRRDTGESYQEFLTTLAQASGIETPTRAELARLDRKRKKKGSNKEWTSPSDPDAKITKMKDGRTHLAHKAEHAVDLDTGAIVAVTIQGADEGDTQTLPDTLAEAVEQLDQVTNADGEPVALADEVVADKGCHSRAIVLELNTHGFRTYISEPDRGEQSWIDQADARDAVYGNRRRIRGDRGKQLLRRRGEHVERSFAHAYDTGGMRRTHLRGTTNILKRVLVHVSGFNLGLVMRQLLGVGTPRGLQGRLAALIAVLVSIYHAITVVVIARSAVPRHRNRWLIARLPPILLTTGRLESGTFVAVGTTVTRRPPHRSVRAELLHTAPTSDTWRRSARSDADAGSWHLESIDRPTPEPLPSHPVSLAPPPKRAVPAPDHLGPKAVQTIHIAGHCMIVEVALYDRPQPLPDFGHWLMPASPKLLLQLTELGRESLTNRLSLDDEPAGLPSLPTHVREAQKVEHLRLALASLLPVFGCVAPELDQARLVRV